MNTTTTSITKNITAVKNVLIRAQTGFRRRGACLRRPPLGVWPPLGAGRGGVCFVWVVAIMPRLHYRQPRRLCQASARRHEEFAPGSGIMLLSKNIKGRDLLWKPKHLL